MTGPERRFLRQLEGNLAYARRVRAGWWAMAAMFEATAKILVEMERERAPIPVAPEPRFVNVAPFVLRDTKWVNTNE